MRGITLAGFLVATLAFTELASASPRLVILDDGEKIARDQEHALPPSPWTGEVALFAMRGETIAIQAIVETDTRIEGVYANLGVFTAKDGSHIVPVVEVRSEHFLKIVRPSGNDHEPGSLAFTAAAAPPPEQFTGFFGDALIPEDASADAGKRAALWIDITIPPGTAAGTYETALNVSDLRGAIGARAVSLRVLDKDLPYAAAKTMVYYEPENLRRRMGDYSAERDLRQVLHAHHLSAFHDMTERSSLDLEDEALSGELFTPEHGYDGPGIGKGEGVFVLGAMGTLGEPNFAHLEVAERYADHLRARGYLGDAALGTTGIDVFLYAIDETCASPWGAEWLDLFKKSEKMAGVRVGVTCGKDPLDQAANLIMMTPADYVPARARIAKAAGKTIWAYNGQRPYSGPLMFDVPATDLRANAWIAARYGIERWFYWESTYWLDDNRGGQGGWDGFDPYVTAETFHNADGDHCNGDGVLLYPGTQIVQGMKDFGVSQLFPSVRLKNLRRGVEDAGYIALAREVDSEAADAIVHRMIPRALAIAGSRAAWPERGAVWLDARKELADIIERGHPATPTAQGCGARAGRGCSASGGNVSEATFLALFVMLALSRVRRGKERLH